MTATALAPALAARERALTAFVDANAEALAQACLALARRFAQGGTLVCWGAGAAATDAAHVAVEFMHPVIVGKRALPALALPNDPSGTSGLETLARPGDIALALSHGGEEAGAIAFLESARRRGMMTVAFSARAELRADHAFAAGTDDPVIAQEVQETGYHVLWELVHVFFEHPGLLGEACITCGDVAVEAEVVAVDGDRAVVTSEGAREEIAVDLIDDVQPGDRLLCHAGVALERTARAESTGFLYPFLEGRGDDDPTTVLADVAASARRKGADTSALRAQIDVDAVRAAGRAVRSALDAGGRLLCFGNGGSATDAQDLAADACARGWPAVALVNDTSTVTAVANDVGFENVFARQLIALGRPGDVAVAISTSGSSPNVVAALAEAARRQLTTVAIVGYGGGRASADHVLAIAGDYVPRLQEAHATLYHLLLEAAA
jgi:D-sedoheptulose 7-phosphate isomerase